ncbi:MAG: DUF1905 domain-containing protein [Humibacillus sp.]|nr:DUF1905 domain-containing protein [Humibacillus sp.]MDN5777787.1 DUF1905 domain-containing protein [Humibacillus sp.]
MLPLKAAVRRAESIGPGVTVTVHIEPCDLGRPGRTRSQVVVGQWQPGGRVFGAAVTRGVRCARARGDRALGVRPHLATTPAEPDPARRG